jgi:hypothetical protein
MEARRYMFHDTYSMISATSSSYIVNFVIGVCKGYIHAFTTPKQGFHEARWPSRASPLGEKALDLSDSRYKPTPPPPPPPPPPTQVIDYSISGRGTAPLSPNGDQQPPASQLPATMIRREDKINPGFLRRSISRIPPPLSRYQ